MQAKPKSDIDETGANAPATLPHETFAKAAVRAVHEGHRALERGAHNVIMALVHADGEELVGPRGAIGARHDKQRKALDLNPIYAHVFGVRALREDGTYTTPGGEVELRREYRERDEPIPEARLLKAKQADRYIKGLERVIVRNLPSVALLSNGGRYSGAGPDGACDWDSAAGRIMVRTGLWFDDKPPGQGKPSLRELWQEWAGGAMSEEQAQGWITLDGTKGHLPGDVRTLDSLRKNALRHFHGTPRPIARPSEIERAQAFVAAVAKVDPEGKAMPAAAHYLDTVLSPMAEQGVAPPEEAEKDLLAIFKDILTIYCVDGEELDLAKVRAIWEGEALRAVA